MNQEIKARWTAALRSGQYQQGNGVLLRDNQYCCLGVLCDLHAKETGQKWMFNSLGRDAMYISTVTRPPKSVMDWAGLDLPNPRIGKYSCMGANDEARLSFTEIADLIDQNL